MNLSTRRRALIIVGSSVLAGCALAAPAPAAPPAPAPPAGPAAAAARSFATAAVTPAGPRIGPGGTNRLASPHSARASTATATSTNWSGYVTNRGTFMSVSASWVEPAAQCRSGSQYASFWVGLDGYESTSVEQIGSDADCAGKTARYYTWYEMFPAKPVSFTNRVRPGDHVTGSVTYTGLGHFTLRLSDAGQDWTQTVTGTAAKAMRNSAEVIVEAPCCTKAGRSLPLADFGTVIFSAPAVNGVPISTFGPVRITMVNAHNKKQDSVSSLRSRRFSVTWLNSGIHGGSTAGGQAPRSHLP